MGALEVRVSRRCAIQIDVYVYLARQKPSVGLSVSSVYVRTYVRTAQFWCIRCCWAFEHWNCCQTQCTSAESSSQSQGQSPSLYTRNKKNVKYIMVQKFKKIDQETPEILSKTKWHVLWLTVYSTVQYWVGYGCGKAGCPREIGLFIESRARLEKMVF